MAERRWLPGFVRRRPFGWAFAATIAASLLISQLAYNWRWSVETDAAVWITYVVEAVALLLPTMVALRWRGVGRRARVVALAICALWWMPASGRAVDIVRELREFIPNMWAVKEMLREPRRAMRTPPDEAAARALAAGDSSFLAVGGECGRVSGVDSAVAQPRGVRVIRGTHHDGESLTNEHGAFKRDARRYAWDYNVTIAVRLKIETTLPDGMRGCVDLTAMRGRAPFFWP
jgi:hypothetical protein